MEFLESFGNTNVCSICTQRHTPKTAVVWCPECEESLCQDCSEHHSISKSSKEHTTIVLEEITNLPKYVTSVRKTCDKHDQNKIDFFCFLHEAPCCVSCINEVHKGCSGIKHIDKALENVKSSYSFEILEASLGRILRNYELIREFKQNSISKTKEQTLKCLADIKGFREKVDSFLDKVEQEAAVVCQVFEADTIDEINETCEGIDKNISITKQKINELTNIKRSATNFQTYSSLKVFRNFVSEQEAETHRLEKGGHFHDKRFWVNPHPVLSDLYEKIGSLALLEKTEEKSKLELEILVTDQSQAFLHTVLSCPSQTKSIVSKKPIKILKNGHFDISGCQIEHKGDLVFVNKREKRFIFYKNADNIIVSDEIGKEPFDLVVLDRIVFFSCCEDKTIGVFESGLNIGKLTYRRINSACWGFDVVDNNNMILRFPNSDRFEIININDGSVIKRIPVPGQYILYVSWFKDKIYCTNWESHQVMCHDDKGKLLWCFQDPILREPMGVTTDSSGNIYVAGSFSNNVVRIEQSGSAYLVVLDESDGLNKPNAIHYQRELNQLLVCNRTDGRAILCQLK